MQIAQFNWIRQVCPLCLSSFLVFPLFPILFPSFSYALSFLLHITYYCVIELVILNHKLITIHGQRNEYALVFLLFSTAVLQFHPFISSFPFHTPFHALSFFLIRVFFNSSFRYLKRENKMDNKRKGKTGGGGGKRERNWKQIIEKVIFFIYSNTAGRPQSWIGQESEQLCRSLWTFWRKSVGS